MATMTGFLGKVVDWLREGYPAGIPAQDTIPVLALLRRRLTDDEVAQIAAELRASGLTSSDPEHPSGVAARSARLRPMDLDRTLRTDAHVGAEITRVTDELPLPEDIQRVAEHLLSNEFPVPD